MTSPTDKENGGLVLALTAEEYDELCGLEDERDQPTLYQTLLFLYERNPRDPRLLAFLDELVAAIGALYDELDDATAGKNKDVSRAIELAGEFYNDRPGETPDRFAVCLGTPDDGPDPEQPLVTTTDTERPIALTGD